MTLTGDPAALDAIFKSVDGRRSAPPKRIETYFDTADGRLHKRGYVLKMRRNGAGHEMTLRTRGDSAVTHREWTAHTEVATADLARLPGDAPRSEIGAILPEELQPQFTSDVKRTSKSIALSGALVDVSLCVGRLRNGGQQAPVNELEFTLRDGDMAVLLAHVKKLVGRRRMTLEVRSRVTRGMELASQAPPRAVKAKKPVLQPTDTLEQALGKIIAVTASQIVGNIAAAADGRDVEGVHQLRVALRRLRSALALFKGHLTDRAERLNDDARQALRLLGPARDLDVFLTETLPPVRGCEGTDPDLKRLNRLAETRRRAAYRDVRKLVGSARFNAFLFDLLSVGEDAGSMLLDPDALLRPVAVKLLKKRQRKVLKLGQGFETLDTTHRHEVRIALKKLRYACDYFQTLFPKKRTTAYLKRLESLQNDLGWMNDATVAEVLVDDLAQDDMQAALGGAVIKGWYRHRLAQVEPHMVAAWDTYAAARPFWKT